MELDDLVKQFQKYDRMAKSADPLLELDIDKLKTTLAQMGVGADDVASLEEAIRHPEKVAWKSGPPLPDKPMLDFTPTQEHVEFIVNVIRMAREGAIWEFPSTGHRYRIEKLAKRFVLIHDVEHDPDDWHTKTKMILGLIGWSMVDHRQEVHNIVALHGRWSIGVFDFNIETQINPKTNQNFPPGSHGQDAVATLIINPSIVRLGHYVAHVLWTKARMLVLGTGTGKTNAPGAQGKA